jgi:hypothetical protein
MKLQKDQIINEKIYWREIFEISVNENTGMKTIVKYE